MARVLVVGVLCSTLVFAAREGQSQQPQQQAQQASPAPAAGPTSAEKFKNIQALKEMPAADLHDAMIFMTASLGTTCEFCHVKDAAGAWAWDKDDRRSKETTRDMIRMTAAINAQSFKGQPQVTCNSCHQGRRQPIAVPLLAGPPQGTPAPAAVSQGTQPQGAQAQGAPPGRPPRPTETVDQVLEKYVQALGGREAIQKIGSLVEKGIVTDRAGQSFPLTVEAKAGPAYRATIESKPAAIRAVNGSEGWTDADGHTRDLAAVEVLELAACADLGLPLQLKARYEGLAARAYDTIDGQATIVLTGRPSPDVVETLYFDRASGLLLRRVARLRAAIGRLPVQIDYSDYRMVEGVKVPFVVRIADWDRVWLEKFREVVVNAPLDAARFAKPAAGSR